MTPTYDRATYDRAYAESAKLTPDEAWHYLRGQGVWIDGDTVVRSGCEGIGPYLWGRLCGAADVFERAYRRRPA